MRIYYYSNAKPILCVLCITISTALAVCVKRSLNKKITSQVKPELEEIISLNDTDLIFEMGKSGHEKKQKTSDFNIYTENLEKSENTYNKEEKIPSSRKTSQNDLKLDLTNQHFHKPIHVMDTNKNTTQNKNIVEPKKSSISSTNKKSNLSYAQPPKSLSNCYIQDNNSKVNVDKPFKIPLKKIVVKPPTQFIPANNELQRPIKLKPTIKNDKKENHDLRIKPEIKLSEPGTINIEKHSENVDLKSTIVVNEKTLNQEKHIDNISDISESLPQQKDLVQTPSDKPVKQSLPILNNETLNTLKMIDDQLTRDNDFTKDLLIDNNDVSSLSSNKIALVSDSAGRIEQLEPLRASIPSKLTTGPQKLHNDQNQLSNGGLMADIRNFARTSLLKPNVKTSVSLNNQPVTSHADELSKSIKSKVNIGLHYKAVEESLKQDIFYTEKLSNAFNVSLKPLCVASAKNDSCELLLLLLAFKYVFASVSPDVLVMKDLECDESEESDDDGSGYLVGDIEVLKIINKFFDKHKNTTESVNSYTDVNEIRKLLLTFVKKHVKKRIANDLNFCKNTAFDKKNKCDKSYLSPWSSAITKLRKPNTGRQSKKESTTSDKSLIPYDTVESIVALFRELIADLGGLHEDKKHDMFKFFPICIGFDGQVNDLMWKYKGRHIMPFFKVMMDQNTIRSSEDVMRTCLDEHLKTEDTKSSKKSLPKAITFKSESYVNFIADRSKEQLRSGDKQIDTKSLYMPFPIYFVHNNQYFVLLAALSLAKNQKWSDTDSQKYDYHVIKGKDIFTYENNEFKKDVFENALQRLQYFGVLFVYGVVDSSSAILK